MLNKKQIEIIKKCAEQCKSRKGNCIIAAPHIEPQCSLYEYCRTESKDIFYGKWAWEVEIELAATALELTKLFEHLLQDVELYCKDNDVKIVDEVTAELINKVFPGTFEDL